jgi:hypothetical protein
MIRRHGILKAAERAVNRDTPTLGYKALAEMGLQKFASSPSCFDTRIVFRSVRAALDAAYG